MSVPQNKLIYCNEAKYNKEVVVEVVVISLLEVFTYK